MQSKARYNYKRDQAYKTYEHQCIDSMQWASKQSTHTHKGAPTMSQSTHEFIDRYVLPTLGFIALIVVWLTA